MQAACVSQIIKMEISNHKHTISPGSPLPWGPRVLIALSLQSALEDMIPAATAFCFYLIVGDNNEH